MYLQKPDQPGHPFSNDLSTGVRSRPATRDDGFRLACGTWVDTGALRGALIGAASALLSEAVIVGEGRKDICLLVFAQEEACRAWLRIQLGDDAPEDRPHTHPLIWDEIAQCLHAFNQSQPAAGHRIARFSIMIGPASIAHGEITELGVLDTRAVLRRRIREIAELYDRPGL